MLSFGLFHDTVPGKSLLRGSVRLTVSQLSPPPQLDISNLAEAEILLPRFPNFTRTCL